MAPPAGQLSIRMLGAFSVDYGNAPVPASYWRQSNAASVIKLLALEANHRMHREQLAALIWPDRDFDTASGNLRFALHRARQGLLHAGAPPGVFVTRDGESVVLGPPSLINTDVAAFEAAVEKAWHGRNVSAAETASSLYSGPLLPDDPYYDWLMSRREVLQVSYLTILSRLAQLYELEGNHGRAVIALERALLSDPANEEIHVALMRAFARSGSRAQALEQFERLEWVLMQEFGVSPEATTFELASAIRDGRSVPKPTPTDGNNSAQDRQSTLPSSLPRYLDAFVGRRREMEELKLLLGSRQLLSLTGPGGVGKTRLAVELGSSLKHVYPDGVEFVDFSVVRDPEQWISMLAMALGASGSAELHLDDVVAILRGRKLLLILDNLEHLSVNSAHIGTLAAKCPDASVIVTSRIRLQIRGEQEYPVSPLSLPESLPGSGGTLVDELTNMPAISLFAHRAQSVKPAFTIDDHNAPAVAALCCKLDGLPLAIELAAARISAFTPDQLLNMLQESMDVLSLPQRDVPLRHRSLRETINWSYELLSSDGQRVLRYLSVFSGGWTLESAAAVCSGQMQSTTSFAEILANLIDHSLIFSRSPAGGHSSRFGMLESVREFASEKLDEHGDHADVQRAHCAYFRHFVEKAKYGLGGPDQKSWLNRLATDHGNLQASLQNAISLNDADTALRMCSSLWRYWGWHGHLSEGVTWIKRALAIPAPADQDVRGDALHALGNLALDTHDYDLASRCFLEALEVWRARSDFDGVAVELTGLGMVARNAAQYEQAEQFFQQALEIWTSGGGSYKVAVAMHNLGDLATQTGDYHRSREWHRQALAIRSQIEDFNGIAYSLLGLSATDLYLGDTENAEARYSETLARFQSTEDVEGQAYALYGLGRCAQRRADPEAALKRFREALKIHHTLADRQGVAECLEGLAYVANAKGENGIAAELLGAAATLLAATEGVLTAADREERRRTECAVEIALGCAGYRRLMETGSALSVDEIVAKSHAIV